MIDLREKKTSKKEDEMEIKFVNKGEKFKSDKADDVEIVDINKGDDKTTVTYKLGNEEKKGDIEDVIKMLNGAEYKKVDDKKESCGDKKEDDEQPKEDSENKDKNDVTKEVENVEEKKKESIEDDSVEITLTEEFHVPGTDIIFEKGDVIRIIPKQKD